MVYCFFFFFFSEEQILGGHFLVLIRESARNEFNLLIIPVGDIILRHPFGFQSLPYFLKVVLPMLF